MIPALLTVKKVWKSYGADAVLRGVSFEVRAGEIVAIIGPSGSGKTTLLKCLNHLLPYQKGEILLNGERLWYEDADCQILQSSTQILNWRLRFGIVFQQYNLFPHRTVLDNLTLAPVEVKGFPPAQARAEGLSLLTRLGLESKAQVYPGQLSGGEQQRVAIARAVALQPEILLFDEVTSAIDAEMVSEVLGLIDQLAKEGRTMILVTHELDFAAAVAQRILFLDHGQVLEEGDPDQVLFHPQSERLAQFLKQFWKYRFRQPGGQGR